MLSKGPTARSEDGKVAALIVDRSSKLLMSMWISLIGLAYETQRLKSEARLPSEVILVFGLEGLS